MIWLVCIQSILAFVSLTSTLLHLTATIHLEIRTPGGLYYLADRHIPAGEDDDSQILKGTYDLHIISAEGAKVLS